MKTFLAIVFGALISLTMTATSWAPEPSSLEPGDVIFEANLLAIEDMMKAGYVNVGPTPANMKSTKLGADVTIILDGMQLVYSCPIVILDSTENAVIHDTGDDTVSLALNCDVLFSDGFE